MTRAESPKVSGPATSAIGGVVGGLATSWVGWLVSWSLMSPNQSRGIDNLFADALSLIGPLLIAAGSAVLGFLGGSLIGALLFPRLRGLRRPRLMVATTVLLDLIAVPVSFALIFFLDRWALPLWVILAAPIALVGAVAPATAWWLSARMRVGATSAAEF